MNYPASTMAAISAAVKKIVYGTDGNDQFDFSGAQNDGITVNGDAGHDKLSLYDVYYASWYGGTGIDIARSELGYNNLFSGGASPDMYFLHREISSQVYDTSGSSAVSDVGGEDLDVTLEGGGNIFDGQGTRDSDITLEGGDNTAQLADSGGGNTIRIDEGTVRLNYGPSFSSQSAPDVVRIGGDGAAIEVKVDYYAMGVAEVTIKGWDDGSSINFGGDLLPKFMATDGNTTVATYSGGNFSLIASGPGASTPNGVILGTDLSWIGHDRSYGEGAFNGIL